MDNSIKKLPVDVVNKIAAGEVIQRPSSILKELVENSIDSFAKKIDVFITDYGKTEIQVSDDGYGMNLNSSGSESSTLNVARYNDSKFDLTDTTNNNNNFGDFFELLSMKIISQFFTIR